jgi:hypothetical protein
VSGKEVETQRFRVGDQGNKIFEFYMYQGTVIDETTEVPSLDELTNIFEGVFVRRFSRRGEGGTFDSADVPAWRAELEQIKSCFKT